MGRLGARGALLAVAVAVLVAAAPAAADDPRAADVPMLVQEYETRHPNLFHGGSRVAFEGAADDLLARLPRLDRDAFLVELMRLAALAGPRAGHQDSASPPAPTPRPSRRSRRAVRAETDQSAALRTLDRGRVVYPRVQRRSAVGQRPRAEAPSVCAAAEGAPDRGRPAPPASGVRLHVATGYEEFGPGDAIEPDVPVGVSWAEFFAGRDHVLAAALALP